MPEGRGTVRNRSFARGDDGVDAAGVNDPGPYATLRLIVVVVVIVERSHNRPGLKPDFHAEDAARKSHGSVLPHNPRLSHPRFTTVSPLCGPGMT